MIKLYGSALWPDCDPVKEVLSAKNIKYAYLDITTNMRFLKDFLKIRDNNSDFDNIKKENKIGIPLIDDDGEIYVNNIDEFLANL